MGVKFAPDKEQAAEELAHGATQQQAADRVERNKQTIWNWCQDPDFKARVEELKTDEEGRAREIILESLPEAAKTVAGAAAGKLDVEPKELAPRLKAALWVLDFLKEKKLPGKTKPTKRSGIKPPIDEEEARGLINA